MSDGKVKVTVTIEADIDSLAREILDILERLGGERRSLPKPEPTPFSRPENIAPRRRLNGHNL